MNILRQTVVASVLFAFVFFQEIFPAGRHASPNSRVRVSGSYFAGICQVEDYMEAMNLKLTTEMLALIRSKRGSCERLNILLGFAASLRTIFLFHVAQAEFVDKSILASIKRIDQNFTNFIARFEPGQEGLLEEWIEGLWNLFGNDQSQTFPELFCEWLIDSKNVIFLKQTELELPDDASETSSTSSRASRLSARKALRRKRSFLRCGIPSPA